MRKNGFTLIEVIAVLVLLGLLFAMAGGGIAAGARGYLLARENSVLSQKAQLALSRMAREFQDCFDCVGPEGAVALPFSYTNIRRDTPANVLAFSGGTITLDGNILVDQVADFNLSYSAAGQLEIALRLVHRSGEVPVLFSTSVLPRNTY
ncbi:type II secretion system protein [Desulfurivibrio sp. D14AmB]|uniref:type II secretion system protein n=1 Tax=Desulfurivibrio sp. D14AmB TaxID=3374370 RepID=UPI00376F42DA